MVVSLLIIKGLLPYLDTCIIGWFTTQYFDPDTMTLTFDLCYNIGALLNFTPKFLGPRLIYIHQYWVIEPTYQRPNINVYFKYTYIYIYIYIYVYWVIILGPIKLLCTAKSCSWIYSNLNYLIAIEFALAIIYLLCHYVT